MFAVELLDGACIKLDFPIRDAPATSTDADFWQGPCRTEGAAFERHRALTHTMGRCDQKDVYLAVPWASWIDSGQYGGEHVLGVAGRVLDIKNKLGALSNELRVHTVCQHIYWPRLFPMWKMFGVTDLWLSHAPQFARELDGIRMHSWPLFAPNIEDPSRRDGLDLQRPLSERRTFCSFRGAWMPHYLSNTRIKLLEWFSGHQGWTIQLSDEWHFERNVYGYGESRDSDVGGQSQKAACLAYNSLLSDSVFSLCPSGAGPNSIRLWESLAAGAIPVVLSDRFRPPTILASTHAPRWQECVVSHSEEDLPSLAERLDSIAPTARERMQRRGRQLYRVVRDAICFWPTRGRNSV